MGSATNAFENDVVDSLVNPQQTMPANTYIGLITTITDGEAGTVTECADTNYGRKQIQAGDFEAAGATTQGSADSTAEIGFTGGAGMNANGSAVGWGIWDAATAGTLLLFDAFASTESWLAGQDPKFASGDLTVTCD